MAFVLCMLTLGSQASDGEPSGDAAIGAKLDPSIKCINSHSHWVLKSRERYLSWIKSPQAGPTGKEAIVYGLYKLSDSSSCQAGLQAAAAMPPPMPALEQAMGNW